MKKYAFFTTSYPSQVTGQGFPRGTFIEDLALQLVKRGDKVHVFTHGSNNSVFIRNKVTIHEFKVRSTFLRRVENGMPEARKSIFFIFQFLIYEFKMLKSFLRVNSKLEFDLIWVHWLFPLTSIAWICGKLKSVKWVATCYGAEIVELQKLPALATNILRKILIQTENIYSISLYTQNLVKEFIKIESEYLPDGIDTIKYNFVESAFLESMGIGKEYIVVGFTGRMVERKGHLVLAKAAKIILQDQNIKIKFILGGNGPLMQDLKSIFSEEELEHVYFPGFIPDDKKVEFLSSLDIFVLPSITDSHGDKEGSATIAFEAMSCCTYSLISNSGGNILPELDLYGFEYFEESDFYDLANKILKLYDGEKVSHSKSELSREFILNHYDWQVILSKLE